MTNMHPLTKQEENCTKFQVLFCVFAVVEIRLFVDLMDGMTCQNLFVKVQLTRKKQPVNLTELEENSLTTVFLN